MEGGERHRIFLYGTLRRGGSRDATQHYRGVEFLGEARVGGELHDLGDYPGLRLNSDSGWVRGELFEVTDAALAALDEWEGIDATDLESSEYRRVQTLAVRDDGARERCWVYEISAARSADGPIIGSGDWLAR